jgi:nucleoside-diphosphate-sugar epimerase
VITGATGFIGRNIAESFHCRGDTVFATGRSEKVGRELSDGGIRFTSADLSDENQVVGAFAPADCVIHCGGKSADWGTAPEFFDANVLGTQNVLRACERHDIRSLIFVSTPSIYFTGRDRFDISESDPLPEKQHTHYARTKLAAERELLALSDRGFRIVILRPRAVLGPYDRTILPRIVSLSEKKRFPLINGGSALTDITYVDNVVDIVRLCLDAGESAWNQVYNVSNGEPICMRDWFAGVLEALDRPFRPKSVPESAASVVARLMEIATRLPFGPKKPSMTRFSVGYMAKSMTMSIDKARRLLGYQPAVSNDEGFQRLARWLGESTHSF